MVAFQGKGVVGVGNLLKLHNVTLVFILLLQKIFFIISKLISTFTFISLFKKVLFLPNFGAILLITVMVKSTVCISDVGLSFDTFLDCYT